MDPGTAPSPPRPRWTYLAIVLPSAVPRALAIVLTRALHGTGDATGGPDT